MRVTSYYRRVGEELLYRKTRSWLWPIFVTTSAGSNTNLYECSENCSCVIVLAINRVYTWPPHCKVQLQPHVEIYWGCKTLTWNTYDGVDCFACNWKDPSLSYPKDHGYGITSILISNYLRCHACDFSSKFTVTKNDTSTLEPQLARQLNISKEVMSLENLTADPKDFFAYHMVHSTRSKSKYMQRTAAQYSNVRNLPEVDCFAWERKSPYVLNSKDQVYIMPSMSISHYFRYHACELSSNFNWLQSYSRMMTYVKMTPRL